jgi:hypothetical protein
MRMGLLYYARMRKSQPKRQPKNLTLSPSAIRMLAELADADGISESAWIEQTIRRNYRIVAAQPTRKEVSHATPPETPAAPPDRV